MTIFVLNKVMYIHSMCLDDISIVHVLCFIYLAQRSTSFGRFDTFRNQHSPSRLEENGTPEVRRIWMNLLSRGYFSLSFTAKLSNWPLDRGRFYILKRINKTCCFCVQNRQMNQQQRTVRNREVWEKRWRPSRWLCVKGWARNTSNPTLRTWWVTMHVPHMITDSH